MGIFLIRAGQPGSKSRHQNDPPDIEGYRGWRPRTGQLPMKSTGDDAVRKQHSENGFSMHGLPERKDGCASSFAGYGKRRRTSL